MDNGFTVLPDQIRAHAANVDAVLRRFDAVRAASGHIAQDDQAYGLLCGWISGILEGRHVRQDELIAKVAENLRLVSEMLRANAGDYEEADRAGAARFRGGE